MNVNKKEQFFDLLNQLEECSISLKEEKARKLKEELRNQDSFNSEDMEIVFDSLIKLVLNEKDKTIETEYLGGIFNVLSIQEAIRKIPLKQKLCDLLANNLEGKYLFSQVQHITLRILFICTGSEESCNFIYNNEAFSEEIFGLVDVILKDISLDIYKSLLLCIQTIYNFSFNCSLNEKNIEDIFNLIYFLSKNEGLSSETYISAYSILLNIDIAVIKKLCDKRDKNRHYCSRNSFSVISLQILETAISVFKENKECDTKKGEVCLNRKVDMVALCCVLEEICKASNEQRKKIAKIIIPYPRNLNIQPTEEESVRGLFCEQLLSADLKLKTAVGSFLFCICKEKESRFVYHFGLGNTAGFLLEKNIFNIEIKGSFVSSDEEIVDKYPENYNIFSGKIRDKNENENEKAKEEELLEIIDRFSKKKKF